ncbi:DNA-binding MarR family transcriptional regulator [Paenibacillus sp. PastF-1]|nr:DNA-binding MarR family transcriptional regulator [Paenibacillus sp. PastF-2]MDF9852049.1 DNA-binding MarR family transcriptional regulator [Paenibacillus sp. PastM-2]MDF9858624.1 DNA-binding MarR family transcriptional regulator [Paenibacillus sp. PastF-1]MDH6483890.1 DNA-binding MarR family transcriptional regulator [Paenibacillus sp. PastH-2]MDH6511259.1 DNA-binding MarR family transcriptional regulator [Paenibacillus sp. PastM-3]
MLDDTSRKLLRIIAQFRYHFKRMPDIKELGRLSGRRPAEITKAFKVLAAENYIQWNTSEPIQKAVILEVWERNVPYDITPQGGTQTVRDGGNIDYWLYH